MPATPDHGLRYPGPDDLPNAPLQIRQLAEDADAALTALVPDSGISTGIDVDPEDGWAVSTVTYRTIGKKLYLWLQVERTGGTITANNGSDTHPGNIADTTIAKINDATKRPTIAAFGEFRCATTGGSCQVNTNGEVRIVDAHTASTITNGDNVNIVITYPIP